MNNFRRPKPCISLTQTFYHQRSALIVKHFSVAYCKRVKRQRIPTDRSYRITPVPISSILFSFPFGSHFSIFHIFIFFTVHKIVYFTSIFQINIYVTLEEERHQITKSREELWARVCNWRALDLRTSFTQLVKTTFRVGILIKFRLGCKMSELDGWKWAPN